MYSNLPREIFKIRKKKLRLTSAGCQSCISINIFFKDSISEQLFLLTLLSFSCVGEQITATSECRPHPAPLESNGNTPSHVCDVKSGATCSGKFFAACCCTKERRGSSQLLLRSLSGCWKERGVNNWPSVWYSLKTNFGREGRRMWGGARDSAHTDGPNQQNIYCSCTSTSACQ